MIIRNIENDLHYTSEVYLILREITEVAYGYYNKRSKRGTLDRVKISQEERHRLKGHTEI